MADETRPFRQIADNFRQAMASADEGVKEYALKTWTKFRFNRTFSYYFGYCDGLWECLASVPYDDFEAEDFSTADEVHVKEVIKDLMYGAGKIAEHYLFSDLPEPDSKHYDNYPSPAAVIVARNKLERRTPRDGFKLNFRAIGSPGDEYPEGFFSAVVSGCQRVKKLMDEHAPVRRMARLDVLFRYGAILVACPDLVELLPGKPS